MTSTLIAVVLASVVAAAPTPVLSVPADRVTIEKLKVNGTGCRRDTVAVAVSLDREAFTVVYSDYLAQTGAGSRGRDERRTCGITVRLNVPSNVSYAITAIDYRGFAHLEPGASAALSARYHFQGGGAPAYTVHPFASGLDDNWQVSDLAGAGLVYSPCGRGSKIDIDTELRVQADRADAPTSLIAMDSTDGEVSSRYHLSYRSC